MEEISDECIDVGSGFESDKFDLVLVSLQLLSLLVGKGFP